MIALQIKRFFSEFNYLELIFHDTYCIIIGYWNLEIAKKYIEMDN